MQQSITTLRGTSGAIEIVLSVGHRADRNLHRAAGRCPSRFAADARAANMAMVDLLKRVAGQKHATPAQIALAWLLAREPWIVPIPGTRNVERLTENIGAASVELQDAELHEITDAASQIAVQGARLPEAVLKLTQH